MSSFFHNAVKTFRQEQTCEKEEKKRGHLSASIREKK